MVDIAGYYGKLLLYSTLLNWNGKIPFLILEMTIVNIVNMSHIISTCIFLINYHVRCSNFLILTNLIGHINIS